VSRVAILCVPGIGHLNPAGALGRALKARGHLVTMFQVPIARARVKAADLQFKPLPSERAGAAGSRLSRARHRLSTLEDMQSQVIRVLTGAPRTLQEEEIELIVADQLDLAASSVAEHLRLPFAAVGLIPPLHLDPSVPPCIFGWRYSTSPLAYHRNRVGNAILSALVTPAFQIVNQQRRIWNLRPFRSVNDLFLRSPTIAQMPEMLEFPRRCPPVDLFYAGPFFDGRGEHHVEFPWERLTGQPLVYASMGTVRNGSIDIFRAIAEACARLDVQLALSLGGGELVPEALGPLPGDPIVVHYAPQVQLLARASTVITHGGLNTTLEALMNGLPLVVIPFTDDQPGVAARIRWTGAGEVVSLRRVTATRIQLALQMVLERPHYRHAAERLQAAIAKTQGVEVAADLIEAISLGRRPSAGEPTRQRKA
jgi:zeaxanthin glucosyltransferase